MNSFPYRLIFIRFILCLFATLLLVAKAQADISLDKAVLEFDRKSQKRTQDILVANNGTENAYIKVERYLVGNDKKRIELKPTDTSLIVNPNKIIIPPGGSKRVRFSLFKQPKEPTQYRVRILPVVGKSTLTSSSDEEASTSTEKVGLQVLIGYEVAVVVK